MVLGVVTRALTHMKSVVEGIEEALAMRTSLDLGFDIGQAITCAGRSLPMP